jgi:hypothetical protein
MWKVFGEPCFLSPLADGGGLLGTTEQITKESEAGARSSVLPNLPHHTGAPQHTYMAYTCVHTHIIQSPITNTHLPVTCAAQNFRGP